MRPAREHGRMVDRPTPDRSETRAAAGGPGEAGPASPGRDGLIAAAIAGLVLATVLIGLLVPAAPGHRAAYAPGGDSSCAEWNDGCRVCQRVGDEVACSLPGIACVPAAPQCLRRVGG